MMAYDTLQRFIFENISIRGELVRLHGSYQAVMERHPYPMMVGQMLGETLAAAALLSAMIKFDGSLTLQAQGDGPVNLLLAQSTEELHLRGLAKWKGADIPDNFRQATGEGYLGIMITPKKGERYQGVVALGEGDLAASLEKYFMQSEQLPTCFLFASNTIDVIGIMLQVIPQGESSDTKGWKRIEEQLKLTNAEELLPLSNELILSHIFPADDIRIFNPEPVSFRCSCNLEKMRQAVRLYGYEQTQDILKNHRYVSVNCEFCNRHYDFDKVDVENIFHEGMSSSGSH